MPSPASASKTRDALIAAAEAFLAEGNAEVSVPELTKRAGVAAGSLYNHFADKHALLEAAALEALFTEIPKLQEIVMSFDDRALGFIVSSTYACQMPERNPRLARIIVTAGVSGFANDRAYMQGPVESITESVERGLCRCDDIEAFVLMASGTYINVLAIQMSEHPVPNLGRRTMKLLGKQLGYTDAQLDEAFATLHTA